MGPPSRGLSTKLAQPMKAWTNSCNKIWHFKLQTFIDKRLIDSCFSLMFSQAFDNQRVHKLSFLFQTQRRRVFLLWKNDISKLWHGKAEEEFTRVYYKKRNSMKAWIIDVNIVVIFALKAKQTILKLCYSIFSTMFSFKLPCFVWKHWAISFCTWLPSLS